ncbi:Ig-like domain-containing protein [Xenorhabdus sp. 18]|uniref:Ig-like domain-containing protein n=1 Tax=Xenorhabdus doucetiae TaxID=351671 RepID=UPI001987C720|nr:Ig-like domain-containing protein [Xenorhabdus sp. 18]MBD2797192.1 Ig-like domain-containing protein [Xenorhabdus sp. 18]
MSIKTNDLIAPSLPQSYQDVIDESELDQDELFVKIKRYEEVRVGYQIIVHLNPYLSSAPFLISDENIEDPTYQITIPFSTIPIGSYDVFYTVTDLVGNITQSESIHVTIKKSDSPPLLMINAFEVDILTNGMPADNHTPNVVLITALDEENKPAPGALINFSTNDPHVRIIPSSGVADQKGQVVFCVTSNTDGLAPILVSSLGMRNKVQVYFSAKN